MSVLLAQCIALFGMHGKRPQLKAWAVTAELGIGQSCFNQERRTGVTRIVEQVE